MPINRETLNKRLYKALRRYDAKPVDDTDEVIPLEDEADAFRFNFTKDGENYGLVYATLDDTKSLTIWFDDTIMDSPSRPTPGMDYNDTFTGFLKYMRKWALDNQLTFKTDNRNHLGNEMARRKRMKEKEKISEGYYPIGKKASYSDAVPNVKIILQHTKVMQEGEQRFRHIEKIFVENTQGERFLVPTTKPGLARVFARHIAEGGTPYDERAGHIQSLVEEYSKMAGFVRATRNGQFNESAQQLVSEGVNHYIKLRESLSKMTGHRGYTAYFENWTPALMEDDTDNSNINELFVQETLDPRIESVMPILSRLHKQVSEMKEVDALSEWADEIISEKMVMGTDSDASASGTVFNEESLDDLEEATDLKSIPEIDEALDPVKKGRLYDLIELYRDATEPNAYYDRDIEDPDEVIAMIRSEFGDKIADQVAAGAEKMHYPRHSGYRSDPLGWKKPVDRITKAGKMYKQDSDYMKNTIKSRYKLSGKSATEEGVEEGLGDFAKKVGGGAKKVVKKVIDFISPDDDEQLRRLQKSAGIQAQHGKPSMAKTNEEEIEESGLQYSIGVKKHGKDYMTKAAELMRNGGTQEELGALKDRLSKAHKSKVKNEGVAEDQLDELSKDTIRNYVKAQPARIKGPAGLATTNPKKAARIVDTEKGDIRRALTKLKDPAYGQQGVAEGSDNYNINSEQMSKRYAEVALEKNPNFTVRDKDEILKIAYKYAKEHAPGFVNQIWKPEAVLKAYFYMQNRNKPQGELNPDVKLKVNKQMLKVYGPGKVTFTYHNYHNYVQHEDKFGDTNSNEFDPKTGKVKFDGGSVSSTYYGEGVAEDLDANQKRVGQLGPTEKVKNNNIGKLVGANENFINMAPQAVAEGQEDLDAILRIIRK